MPFIQTVEASGTNKVHIQLPKIGLKVDWRAIQYVGSRYDLDFDYSINRDMLTVKRDDEYDWINGWKQTLYLRIYDPDIEEVPLFDSTKEPYIYNGLGHEQAPRDVLEVIVDPSVKVIKACAFFKCTKMKRCIMGNQVEGIEKQAFYGCHSLNNVKLSRSLRYIGFAAFVDCHAFTSLFVPPTVQKIENCAFAGCVQIQFLVLPPDIDLNNDVGDELVITCHKLLTNPDIQYTIVEDPITAITNNHAVNAYIQHRDDDLPLHKLCVDPNVTADMIRQMTNKLGTDIAYRTDDHHKLTPLHILCSINPHASVGAIAACFDANPSALFTPEARGITPLDFLWDNSNTEAIVHLFQDLSINRRSERSVVSKMWHGTFIWYKAMNQFVGSWLYYVFRDLPLSIIIFVLIVMQLILHLILWFVEELVIGSVCRLVKMLK